MGVFEELKERGLIAQITHEEQVKELLNNQKVTFYIGFDPTADSLHVGHFLQMMIMARMQKAGHRPIVLIGGGTGMVGDPSGKSDMRKMMTRDTVKHNCDCFRKQMSNFIDFSEDKAMMVDNGDWLLNLNYIDFMREYGVHFSVNRMLSFECFKQRLERGLSFFEFNYMLMQSYDFLHLFRTYGCQMEFGGDDQWSNILGGVELIRRVEGKEAYGVTFTLLATSEGKKMGKTEKGAVWLDPEKTSPYEFFQYWRNVADADVVKCMKLLTFIPMEEIREYEKIKDEKINEAKERLAFELTKTVHGEEEANKALESARALFGGGQNLENIPKSIFSIEELSSATIVDLLVMTKLCPSKGEARRLVSQGGVSVNDEKVEDFAKIFSPSDFEGDFIIKKGKKTYHRITVR